MYSIFKMYFNPGCGLFFFFFFKDTEINNNKTCKTCQKGEQGSQSREETVHGTNQQITSTLTLESSLKDFKDD